MHVTSRPHSHRPAIKKYEESLPLWRDVGDALCEAQALDEIRINLSEPKKGRRGQQFLRVDEVAHLLRCKKRTITTW